MPLPLLLGVPLVNWVAGSVAASGTLAGLVALERQQGNEAAINIPDTFVLDNTAHGDSRSRSRSEPCILFDSTTEVPLEPQRERSHSVTNQTITPAHRPSIRALELALLSFVAILQTARRDPDREQAQGPLNSVLIWTKRIAYRIGDIPIGRDADTVAQAIQERI